jgi:hypothetical protein
MDPTLRMDEVKQPTSHQARATQSLRCGALRNVVRDSDRMSMTTRLPMLPADMTTSKRGKAKVVAAEICHQMNTRHSQRSNFDDKES